MHIQIHVVPSNDEWQVEGEGGLAIGQPVPDKDDAIHRAVAIAEEHAKNGDVCSVRIHRRDGTFEEERTFPRSADPFPPAG